MTRCSIGPSGLKSIARDPHRTEQLLACGGQRVADNAKRWPSLIAGAASVFARTLAHSAGGQTGRRRRLAGVLVDDLDRRVMWPALV